MKVALLCDSPDERWPSMDLVGDMLAQHLTTDNEQILRPIRALTPNLAVNRVLFRFLDYPLWARRNVGRFDVFHILDHSYSQLAHHLPPDRTVVTCHDIDTFRSVLEPAREQRGPLFRAMTRRILAGFQRVAHVACDSHATLSDLVHHNVLPPSRLSVVPLGTHPSCSPDADPDADRQAAELLGPTNHLDLLHIGSTIRRKRVDVLLRVFAEAQRTIPRLRLLRVGGPFTPEQTSLAHSLNIANCIIHLPFLTRPVLAAVYRRTALVLFPSDAEGFGLPVAEAMACGAPVLASDLAVLREIGGSAITYAPVADVSAWHSGLQHLLSERSNHPDQWAKKKLFGLNRARLFSWKRYSNSMANVYNRLL